MTQWIFVLLSCIALTSVAVAREIPQPYNTLEITIDQELVKISISDVYEIIHERSDTEWLSRRQATINIDCKTMCGGGYQELVDACSFGAFQFTPGSNDIVTEWVPNCMQPFRVIVYNISSAGVRKVLDAGSGVPPQFTLGKTVHCDIRTFEGTSGNFNFGTGKFKLWTWNGDHYELEED